MYLQRVRVVGRSFAAELSQRHFHLQHKISPHFYEFRPFRFFYKKSRKAERGRARRQARSPPEARFFFLAQQRFFPIPPVV
jgi:hypothetical protein